MTAIHAAAAGIAPAMLDSRPVGADNMLAQPDDTQLQWGCIFGEGVFYVLDTGRAGPDNVVVTLHADGSVTVDINGRKYEFSAEEARNLRVRVDDNDSVEIQDNRDPIDRLLNPEPVQVFKYP